LKSFADAHEYKRKGRLSVCLSLSDFTYFAPVGLQFGVTIDPSQHDQRIQEMSSLGEFVTLLDNKPRFDFIKSRHRSRSTLHAKAHEYRLRRHTQKKLKKVLGLKKGQNGAT